MRRRQRSSGVAYAALPDAEASAYAALADAEDEEDREEKPLLPVRKESELVPELVEEKDDVRKRSESSPEEETALVTVLSLLYSFTQQANFGSVMLTGFSS